MNRDQSPVRKTELEKAREEIARLKQRIAELEKARPEFLTARWLEDHCKVCGTDVGQDRFWANTTECCVCGASVCPDDLVEIGRTQVGEKLFACEDCIETCPECNRCGPKNEHLAVECAGCESRVCDACKEDNYEKECHKCERYYCKACPKDFHHCEECYEMFCDDCVEHHKKECQE